MSAGRTIAAIAMLTGMTACAAIPGAGPATPASAPAQPPASAYGRAPRIMGADAKQLISQFGQPRLDIRERTVHKLQFANGQCVLDAYLYSPSKGRQAVVTHVDARLPDGRDTDINACAAALSRR